MDHRYPTALSGRIGFLLSRAHFVARENADRAIGKFGLTARGFAVLATLVGDGPTSQQTLSKRLRVDPATMVDVIDALERSGHIVRARNPRDRREYALQTTAKGKALFARADRSLVAAEAETLRGLSAHDVQSLTRMLMRIATASNTPVTADLVPIAATTRRA